MYQGLISNMAENTPINCWKSIVTADLLKYKIRTLFHMQYYAIYFSLFIHLSYSILPTTKRNYN